MARALFAWELGDDLGHARRLLHVARELRALGHETAFAFLDLTALAGERGPGAEWFQAPIVAPLEKPNQAPANASDILLNRGFGDAATVVGALRGWMGIFGLWKPDLLVADYAPGALLAARAAGLRSIGIGSGFSTPRSYEPVPALRNWATPEPEVLHRCDARLVTATRDAFARIDAHARAPSRIADVFEPGVSLFCTWPEIDPFGARDGAEYFGPQDDVTRGAHVAWLDDALPRVLAYLKPRDPRFLAILQALRAAAGDAIVAAPGLQPGEAARLSAPNLRVYAEPLALQPLLATADLCVCHGGAGMVARTLQAGVALALLPMHVEQLLVSRRVVDAGAGVLAPDTPDLGPWIRDALARSGVREAAAASPLRSRVPASAAARISRELGG